jgi:hypothetical protein
MDYVVGTTERANYVSIGEEIRAKLGTDTKYPPDQLSAQIGAVYDKGITEGITEGIAQGITQGIEQGKQTAYDEFWDNYQDFGNLNYYFGAFAGPAWGKYATYLVSVGEVFKPKYPIVFSASLSSCKSFMQRFNRQKVLSDDLAIDLTEFCRMLDFSKVTGGDYAFESALADNVTADFSNATSLAYTFALLDGGYLRNITLKVSEKCTNLTTTFSNNSRLYSLTFMEGSVIAGSINLQWANFLSRGSIESVMTHLSTTATGKTVTFSKAAVDRAFATSPGAGDGSTSAEWQALKDPVLENWSISLM